MKSNPNPKPEHGTPCVANCTQSANKVKLTATTHDPPASSYAHYPPLPAPRLLPTSERKGGNTPSSPTLYEFKRK
eukprot:scaffold186454_cov41-Attheya_sp.AAC.2